jgi:GTPase SAR1 family protein
MMDTDEKETLVFKILIVGAAGVGKSSLFLRYTVRRESFLLTPSPFLVLLIF